MSTELIARLRGHAEIMVRDKGKFVRFIESADCVEAADLIEAQAAEIERLREALAFYANGMEPFGNTARNALENKP